MKFIALLFLSVLAACSSAPQRTEADVYRGQYLNDSQTPDTIKKAIEAGVVILGMCPLQAIAAAGMPGPYMVKPDKEVWGPGPTYPPSVVRAQCAKPDRSEIQLKFRNASQFNTTQPVVFNVRFVEGKVVQVERQE